IAQAKKPHTIGETIIAEDMLFSFALEGSCTGNDFFTNLDTKIQEEDLSWDKCVSVCTDGTGAIFLIESGSHLADHLTDPKWLVNLTYLVCIFDKLNILNSSLQGTKSMADKINAFTKKLERWAVALWLCELKAAMSHLQGLLDQFMEYFPKETPPQRYDWLRQLFMATGDHLSSDLEIALMELSSDQTLKAMFVSTTHAEFWISVAEEYPGISKAAMDVLILFGSTYLCEATFSTLTYIKNNVTISCLNVQDDLKKQAHPSH
ncbi:SCND3 protein, partial [Amia calva]|nr:SCND3 protein [Amia calva]